MVAITASSSGSSTRPSIGLWVTATTIASPQNAATVE